MAAKKRRSTDLAHHLGISTSSVSNWKVRDTDPPAEFILLICEFLDISVSELLGSGCPSSLPESATQTPAARARAAFCSSLTDEHISLIHCYNSLNRDEQGKVWDTITCLQRRKKESSCDSPEELSSDSPNENSSSLPRATTA